MDNLDKSTMERFEFLNHNYISLVNYHLIANSGKIYLGDKANRVCRFCNKDDTQTAFKNESHALPEFIGNKILIANYECDECNSKFSSLLENHMANYMKLWHTLAQIKGKRGVPSYKTNQKKSRIDLNKDSVLLKDFEDDNITKIDEENKTLTITAERPSYIPIAVYKCLVKMALTIIPEKELQYFGHSLKWISEGSHDQSAYRINDLSVLFSMAPGVHPFPFVTAALFKRMATPRNDVPYMIFLLAYGNFVFQIFLPMCLKDLELQGKDVKMVFIPTPIDMVDGADILIRKKINFSDREIIKAEKTSMTMQFERMEEKMPGTNAEE